MLGCGAGGAAAGATGGRCVGPLLAHLNLLLVLYGGAALATAARLKWDPSTYVALRELFPREYALLAGAAAAAGAALLLAPHVALAGLNAARPTTRRALLYVYAGVMSALFVGVAALGAWLAVRVRQWLQSDAALQLREALELKEHLQPLLRYFGRWHPVPSRIDLLIQEAEQDAPRNLYVMAAALALWAPLHALAVALALWAARLPQSSHRARRDLSYDSETAPLRIRTTYKNGRIVVL